MLKLSPSNRASLRWASRQRQSTREPAIRAHRTSPRREVIASDVRQEALVLRGGETGEELGRLSAWTEVRHDDAQAAYVEQDDVAERTAIQHTKCTSSIVMRGRGFGGCGGSSPSSFTAPATVWAGHLSPELAIEETHSMVGLLLRTVLGCGDRAFPAMIEEARRANCLPDDGARALTELNRLRRRVKHRAQSVDPAKADALVHDVVEVCQLLLKVIRSRYE